MHRIVLLRILLAVLLVAAASGGRAQQVTMKAGVMLGKMDSREISGNIRRMLNIYWETNYSLRIVPYRYVTFGLAYLGAGGKFSETTDFDPTKIISYDIQARFNNVLIPIKFKVSTEHRRKPRVYGYVGTAPGVMFYEARDITFTGDSDNQPLERQKKIIFGWSPRHFQNYIMVGGGAYYRHIILEIGAYVSTFKNYKEFKAPIVFNSGIMLNVGYQVSNDETKRW